MRLKLLDLALADFSKCIELDPEDAQSYHQQSLIYLEQKLIDMAQTTLDKALALELDNDVFHPSAKKIIIAKPNESDQEILYLSKHSFNLKMKCKQTFVLFIASRIVWFCCVNAKWITVAVLLITSRPLKQRFL